MLHCRSHNAALQVTRKLDLFVAGLDLPSRALGR